MLIESLFGWVGLGIGAWADKSFQPYWRYGRTGKPLKEIYQDGKLLDEAWLTRGSKAPYGHDWALAKDKLQLPRIPNKVERINVPWWRYVGGPPIRARNYPDLGSGGDWQWRVGGI